MTIEKPGYLSEDLQHNILKVKEIYGILTIDNLVNTVAEHNTSSFYRKSEKLVIDKTNMLAWSKLALYEANKIEINIFAPDCFDQLRAALNSAIYNNVNVKSTVKTILAEFGIKAVFLEKLDKTPVDGFSFWSKDNPAIAFTLRLKRIDNFAFTLFQELGHIFLHLQNEINRNLN